MRREHEPRAGVGGPQRPAEPPEQRLAAAGGGAAARPRARRPARPTRARIWRVDVREQRAAAVVLEQPQRLLEPLAVEVGVEVAEAGREAAAHLPVRGRPRPLRHRAPAVAQPEQRVELLDQLGRRRAPAHRADADRVSRGRLVRDLEDRERDVEPAAQVDVAVGALLEVHVARRQQPLDQPVLEQQRAQLGLGRLVVDVLGLAGPGHGRREVRAGARAQADRLADVERVAVGVAEDVDARVVGELGEVGPLVARALGAGRAPAPAGALLRPHREQGVADRERRRAEPRQQRAQHARARLGVGQRAVRLGDLDPERVGQRREPAAALQRREAARERDRAQHRRVGPVERGAGEGLPEHARVERRVVRDEHRPAQQLRQLGQHRLRRRRLVDHRLRDAR